MNFDLVGYSNVPAIVSDAMASEDRRLETFARFLKSNRLNAAPRAHDWARLGRGYDGPDYASNSYEQRLAAQYARFNIGPLPDLTTQAASPTRPILDTRRGPWTESPGG
ncbi:MAG: DUF3380 domain-containing protein [Acetobacteraceae bacterium]|nr:DUF3380 domain-containing protein [Acetobacteraceae bacterium]